MEKIENFFEFPQIVDLAKNLAEKVANINVVDFRRLKEDMHTGLSQEQIDAILGLAIILNNKDDDKK